MNNETNLSNLILKYGGRSALQSTRCWQRLSIKIGKHEEHLTFNIKCRKYELIPSSLKVKPFDLCELGYKYAKDYSLKCLKVRVLECRKKLFYMKKKVESIVKELKN
jgi:hypothetical protein